jgi:hypothetical protein
VRPWTTSPLRPRGPAPVGSPPARWCSSAPVATAGRLSTWSRRSTPSRPRCPSVASSRTVPTPTCWRAATAAARTVRTTSWPCCSLTTRAATWRSARHVRFRLDAVLVQAGLGTGPARWCTRSSTGSDLRIGPGCSSPPGAHHQRHARAPHAPQRQQRRVPRRRAGRPRHAQPGALVNGNVTLGDRSFLGTGAVVLPATVGADGHRGGCGRHATCPPGSLRWASRPPGDLGLTV